MSLGLEDSAGAGSGAGRWVGGGAGKEDSAGADSGVSNRVAWDKAPPVQAMIRTEITSGAEMTSKVDPTPDFQNFKPSSSC